jgi:uncharacterized protein with PQ loop repeat
MCKNREIEPILGYIGAAFLIVRFIPLFYEQIFTKKKTKFNILLFEAIASIFLGISAIMINAYPTILANSVSLLNILIISVVQIKLRIKSQTITQSTTTPPPQSTTTPPTPITLTLTFTPD